MQLEMIRRPRILQHPIFHVGDERAAGEREGGESSSNPDSVVLPAQIEESGLRRDM